MSYNVIQFPIHVKFLIFVANGAHFSFSDSQGGAAYKAIKIKGGPHFPQFSPEDRLLQNGHVALNNLPSYVHINTEVIMDKNIAKSRDSTPLDF